MSTARTFWRCRVCGSIFGAPTDAPMAPRCPHGHCGSTQVRAEFSGEPPGSVFADGSRRGCVWAVILSGAVMAGLAFLLT